MATTSEALDELALAWNTAKQSDAATRERAVREARALLRDRTKRDLAWFLAAFDDPQKWAFAVTVVHGNLPRKLLRPIVAAAVRHPNVSSNQWFIRAAVKNFGVDEVRAILDEHFAAAPDKWERDKVRAAMYWLGYAARDTESERIRKRISKLSAEQRLRLFMACDEDTQRELVWLLPYNEPKLRALLDEALEFAKRQGNRYVLAVLQDKKLL